MKMKHEKKNEKPIKFNKNKRNANNQNKNQTCIDEIMDTISEVAAITLFSGICGFVILKQLLESRFM